MTDNVIHVAFGSKPRPVEDRWPEPSVDLIMLDEASPVTPESWSQFMQRYRQALQELGMKGDIIEEIDKEFER